MTEYRTFNFEKGDFVENGNNNGFTPGYLKVGNENKKETADTFRERFVSNMADYFDKTDKPFDFTGGGGSTSDKVAAFTDQFEGGYNEVADNFGIFQPRTNPMSVIPGQEGRPGFLQQIAGPVAGAAAKAIFKV